MSVLAAVLVLVQGPTPQLPTGELLRTRDLTARIARSELVLDRGALDRATLRGEDVLVKVPVGQLPLRDLEFLELDAAGAREAAGRVEQRGDEVLLSLPKDASFVMRPKSVESLRLGTEPTWCGGALLQVTGRVTAEGRPEVRQWSLFLRTRHEPLPWSDAAGAYATGLVVGVEDAEQPARSEPLPRPVLVQFFLSGRGLELEPTSLAITRSGQEGFVEAALRCRVHDVEQAAIGARGSFGEQRWSFGVEPALGSLAVEPSPSTILGFGLETAAVIVRRRAEDGRDWAAPTPLAVTLTAGRGALPALLEIPAGASEARAELRSASVGLFNVTASADGLRSDPAPILYAWPVALLGVTLVFGALGGLVRAIQDERKRAKTRRSGGRVAFRAAAGAFTALVLVPAVLLGLAQTGFDASTVRTEAGAAVLAALAGWVGTAVLNALAKKLGLQPADEPPARPTG